MKTKKWKSLNFSTFLEEPRMSLPQKTRKYHRAPPNNWENGPKATQAKSADMGNEVYHNLLKKLAVYSKEGQKDNPNVLFGYL